MSDGTQDEALRGTVRRILVATDFSEDADHALDMVISLGKALAATVELVHVYDLPMLVSVAGMPPPQADPDVVLKAHRQLGERVARLREAGVDCLATALGGDAAGEIVSQAEKTRADMVVMGRRGLGRLRRLFVGSVTERVLRTIGSPVLVIPHAG